MSYPFDPSFNIDHSTGGMSCCSGQWSKSVSQSTACSQSFSTREVSPAVCQFSWPVCYQSDVSSVKVTPVAERGARKESKYSRHITFDVVNGNNTHLEEITPLTDTEEKLDKALDRIKAVIEEKLKLKLTLREAEWDVRTHESLPAAGGDSHSKRGWTNMAVYKIDDKKTLSCDEEKIREFKETPESEEEQNWRGATLFNARPEIGTVEPQKTETIDRPKDTVTDLFNAIDEDGPVLRNNGGKLSSQKYREALVHPAVTSSGREQLEPIPATVVVSDRPKENSKSESQDQVDSHLSTQIKGEKSGNNIKTDKTGDESFTFHLNNEPSKPPVKSTETHRDQLKRTSDSQKKELDAVNIKHSNSKEQVSSLCNDTPDKQQVLEETKEKFRKQSEEDISLKSQLDRSAEKILGINTQSSRVLRMDDPLEKEISALEENIERLMSLVSPQGNLLAESTEAKHKMELVKNGVYRLKCELTIKDDRHYSIIEDMREKSTLERELSYENEKYLKNRISQEIEKQSELKEELESVKLSLGKRIGLIGDVESRLRQLEIDMLDNIKKLEWRLDNSKKNSDKLRSIISEKDGRISSLLLELETQDELVGMLEQEIRIVRSENADFKRQLGFQESKVADVEYTADRQRRQIEHEKSQHQAMLAQAEKTISEYEDELDSVMAELKKIKSEKYQDDCKCAVKEDAYEEKLVELEYERDIVLDELQKEKLMQFVSIN